MERFFNYFVCLLIVTLTVLAAWQVQRNEVGWVVFDVLLAGLLLALRFDNDTP